MTPAFQVEPWLRARIAQALLAEGCPSEAATSLAEEAYFEKRLRGEWMLRLWRCGASVPWPITVQGVTDSVEELAGNVADHNEEQHDSAWREVPANRSGICERVLDLSASRKRCTYVPLSAPAAPEKGR